MKQPVYPLGTKIKFKGILCTIVGARWSRSMGRVEYEVERPSGTSDRGGRTYGVHENAIRGYMTRDKFDEAMTALGE